jgi:hypothetical protein
MQKTRCNRGGPEFERRKVIYSGVTLTKAVRIEPRANYFSCKLGKRPMAGYAALPAGFINGCRVNIFDIG